MSVVTTANITLADINDAIIDSSEPKNPIQGTLWIDTEENSDNYILKRWDESSKVWETVGKLDPNLEDTIEQAKKDAENNANDHTDTVKKDLKGEIGDVSSSLNGLQDYIDNEFEEGVIEKSEAKAIGKYLNSLESDKEYLDKKYISVHGNPDLFDDMQVKVKNKKDNYDSAHSALVTKIQSVVQSSRASSDDLTKIDNLFSDYNTSLATLSETLSDAEDVISQGKADRVEKRVKRYAVAKEEYDKAVKQLKNDVADKVDGTSYQNKIDQIVSDIKDKADLTYVNGELTDKVDQSGYNTTISGIKSDIADKAGLTYVDGKLSDKADSSTVSGLKQDVSNHADELNKHGGKISSVETDIDTVKGELSATTSSLETAKGNISSNESNIKANANSIETKVSQDEFDNLQVGSRNYILNSDDIKETSPAKFHFDNGILEKLNGEQITVSFDARLKNASSGETHDLDSFIRHQTNAVDWHSKSFTANKNWQRYSYTEKITQTIVNKAEETELTLAFRSNQYTGDNTSTKTVEITNVKMEKGNTATDWTPAPEDIDDNINSVKERVSSAESSITQNADNISSKVEKTQYTKDQNDVVGRLDSAESSISQNADNITSKVSQDTYDSDINDETNGLKEKVSSAESSIKQNADNIESKVSQSDYDSDINNSTNGLKAKVSQAESDITQNANDISSKVSQTKYSKDQDDVVSRLDSAESSITQNADSIESKVEQSTYNSDMEGKQDNIPKQNTEPSSPSTDDLWWDTSQSPNVLKRYDGTGWEKTTPTKAEEVGAFSDSEGSNLKGRVDSAESSITQNADSIKSKVEQTEFNKAEDRISSAETSIEQNADNITSKVEQTDFNNAKTRIDDAESSIKQNADSIESKVDQTKFNSAESRIQKAESNITQNSDSIEAKVSKDTYDDDINGKTNGLKTRMESAESNITQNENEIKSKVSSAEFDDVKTRVNTAEQKIEDDAIVSTVTNSEAYLTGIDSKADLTDLNDYSTKGEVDEVSDELRNYVDDSIDDVNFEQYVTDSELEQTSDAITAKFKSTGGTNLLKNSVGYGGLKYWDESDEIGSLTNTDTVTSSQLDSLGFGSGFHFDNGSSYKRELMQTVKVNSGTAYTLSLNRYKQEPEGNLDIQLVDGDGDKIGSIKTEAGMSDVNYIPDRVTVYPSTSELTVKIVADSTVDAIVTGLMLNIGDVPLQWSLASGELYNTNVQMDLSGIRVSRLNGDGEEIGYTQMTPQEFAGYYDTSGSGDYEKIFYIREDETVSKKFSAEEEFTMGNIKIIRANSSNRNGWAFVPNADD